jgi:tripeptidyl-peptidase I
MCATSASVIAAAEGILFPASGTSASSPVVAAMLSSVNDARLAVGKKPIGFINPTVGKSTYLTFMSY